MKIVVIGHNFWGVGGTVRTVYNIAEGLGALHDVHLVSVHRRATHAAFSLPQRVQRNFLVDGTRGSADRNLPEFYLPSTLVPATEEFYSDYSALTDARIVDFLRTTDADVIVGTRPSINLIIASHAPRHKVLDRSGAHAALRY